MSRYKHFAYVQHDEASFIFADSTKPVMFWKRY